MQKLFEISQFTRQEKLDLFETLWEDLSKNETNFESPEWHAELLSKTESRIKENKENISDWNEAKTLLNKHFK
ncbi:MAG: addiction module protein [Spirochaetes bacterium]|nr:addiction module protein [Spirochaetota bacterium]